MFGRNPNYPNKLTNNPPALETEVSSITVAENLKAMNNAQNAFIQAERSKKIKRARHLDTRLEAATTHFSKMVIKSTIFEIIIRNGKNLVASLVKKVKAY